MPPASEMIDGATAAGLADVRFAVDSETAGDLLVEIVTAGDVILVKGSRGVRTEKVIEKLLTKFELEDVASAAG